MPPVPAVALASGRPPHRAQRVARDRERGAGRSARGGLKLGTPARAAFAQRVRELAGDDQAVMPIIEPLLAILDTMLAELARLTKQVLALARNEEICRRLMTVRGSARSPR